MERKIGEIFEYNGEWYQCIEQPKDYIGNVCKACDFSGRGNCELDECGGTYRADKKSVIFKKLIKIGEPYMLEDIKFQKYKVFKTPYIYHKIDCSWQSFADPYYISLEIKENMEEKKLNLKPFDLEAARSGKPVCTREGRPARIICFDRKGYRKIVALVHTDYYEDEIIAYTIEGHRDCKSINTIDDLMMAPERHEGWINVYKGGKLDTDYLYPSKEDAVENIFQPMKDNYIDTIKLTWEE